MKFFEDYARKAEAEFLAHIRPEILALSKRPQRITLEEYKQLRGNSWEQMLLRRNVDNETLCRNALYYLDNAGVGGKLGPWDVADTYSEALMREMVPKLVDLAGMFRQFAKGALERNHSDPDASGKAVAYLDAADRLETALKAQAEAAKAAAAPKKPTAPPKKK